MILKPTRFKMNHGRLFHVLHKANCHVRRDAKCTNVALPGLDRHLIPYFGEQQLFMQLWDQFEIHEIEDSTYEIQFKYWTTLRIGLHLAFTAAALFDANPLGGVLFVNILLFASSLWTAISFRSKILSNS